MSLFLRALGRGKSHQKDLDPEDIFLDSTNLASLDMQQMEGQLERPLSPYISNILTIFLIIFITAFSFRLYSMQVVSGADYKEKAMNNYVRSTPIFAHRGTISDRNGNLLAWNEEETKNVDNKNPTSSVSEIPKRVYIEKAGFSHVLGYVSYPKKDSSGIFWQDEYIGKDGIEKIYQDRLQGISGEKYVAVSARQEVQSENVTLDPVDGENLKLTIDTAVQNRLYHAIANLAGKVGFTGGAGVIMDVNSGEVIALVSYPEYNNNLITNAKTSEEKDQVERDLTGRSKKFLNRAVSGLFTPGSTVKPFIAYAALEEDIIDPLTNIFSSGALVIKNKYGGPDTVFKDWKAHGYVDMREAIAVSSDEYFYQIGGGFESQKGLGIDRIAKYGKMFGFDTPTNIDLPSEKKGIIPTPEWKKKIFGEDWILGNTYHTSIGQYGFQITALELVRGVAAIANGGKLITPHLLLGTVDLPIVDLNLNQKNLQVIKEGMRKGVIDGVAKVLNVPGVTVAAKSGTAELGLSKEYVNSWISGYFPYENPKYAFVVIMEKGPRGNLTGAAFVMNEMLTFLRDETSYTKP